MSIHIGKELRDRLKHDGKSVVWLARQLGCHRTNVYNLFDKYSIDTQLLMRISSIMHHNFFDILSREANERIEKENTSV